MKRREFITLLGGSSASVVWSLPLGAQRGGTAARLPRIGYLTLSPISDKPSPERAAFLQGLRVTAPPAARSRSRSSAFTGAAG